MNNNSKTINIFGTTYTIEYVDKIETDNPGIWRFSETDTASHTIQVCTKLYNGLPINKEEMNENLIHEIIHAILDEGMYFSESSNEPLVEWLSRCIYSILKQNIL